MESCDLKVDIIVIGREGIKCRYSHESYNDSFSLYFAASHMAHVLVYYTLLVVIIIYIMFVKLRKMLEDVVKRGEFGYTREWRYTNVTYYYYYYSLCTDAQN